MAGELPGEMAREMVGDGLEIRAGRYGRRDSRRNSGKWTERWNMAGEMAVDGGRWSKIVQGVLAGKKEKEQRASGVGSEEAY